MAPLIDANTMYAIGVLVAIAVGFFVVGIIVLSLLVAYSRRWQPMKGVKDEGYFTILGEHKDGTYEPIAGEFFEATHLYLNRERELEDKQNQLFKLTSRLMELTDDDGNANTAIAGAESQLTVLRPLRISLFKNRDLFLCDCLRVHISRSSTSGVIYFLVQYDNLQELISYATVSRRAGLEWRWESLALKSRRLVKCYMDDVDKSFVQNLSKYSDLPTKGVWKWIRPYKGEQPTAADREPPPNGLIQMAVQEGKVGRMMNEVPTIQRQMKDMQTVLQRKDKQILDASMENHDIREGFADMGWGQLGPRREALTTMFLIAAAVAVGGAAFLGFRLGQEMGGVLGAVFAILCVGGLYSSGRLDQLK